MTVHSTHKPRRGLCVELSAQSLGQLLSLAVGHRVARDCFLGSTRSKRFGPLPRPITRSVTHSRPSTTCPSIPPISDPHTHTRHVGAAVHSSTIDRVLRTTRIAGGGIRRVVIVVVVVVEWMGVVDCPATPQSTQYYSHTGDSLCGLVGRMGLEASFATLVSTESRSMVDSVGTLLPVLFAVCGPIPP